MKENQNSRKAHIWSLIIIFVLLFFLGCSSNSTTYLDINFKKLVICPTSAEDSILLIVNLKNLSKEERVYNFCVKEKDNEIRNKTIPVYKLIYKTDSNTIDFNLLFTEAGKVALKDTSEIDLLFFADFSTDDESFVDYKKIKKQIINSVANRDSVFFLIKLDDTQNNLIKKKDFNGTKDVKFIKKMEIPFDNLLERCNLSFEDKLKLVGGSIYYVSDE